MFSPQDIHAYLHEAGWIKDLEGPETITFLAAGEYNENWKITAPSGTSVFRINHGSQLGLDNQISYEFAVLQAVAPSGVTPRALYVDPLALGKGALLMEYLPGRSLDYRKDTLAVAELFAKVHALWPDSRLLVQCNPMEDIGRESWDLLHKYPDHQLPEVRGKLLSLHEEIMDLGARNFERFSADGMVMVNTEVNSGNFIVNNGRIALVDWEKAVSSSRYQDLGHFLAPTTTLWKTDHVFSEEEKLAFLEAYLRASHLEIPLEEAREMTRLIERTILLRGLSWCYMAYYEYTRTERALANKDTFQKINQYFDKLEWLFELTA